MSIDEARDHVGRQVIYRPCGALAGDRLESGVISSVNAAYVFVRYGSDLGSKATHAEQLELAHQDAAR